MPTVQDAQPDCSFPASVHSTPSRITFAGTPASNDLGGHDLVTTAPAATTEPLPIVTPLSTVALQPIQTRSSITMGEEYGGGPKPRPSSSMIVTPNEIEQSRPIETPAVEPAAMVLPSLT